MPAAMPVTVLPDTVQIPVVVLLNVTGNPELAVALSIPVPPTVTLGALPKAMLWLAVAGFGISVQSLAAVEARKVSTTPSKPPSY